MLGMGLSIAKQPFIGLKGNVQDIIPSAVFEINANVAASYPGTGQEWFNVIQQPADGLSSARSVYDFTLGDTTNAEALDPTYSAGPPAEFTLDGGDYVVNKTPTPAWVSNMHQLNGTGLWTVVYGWYKATAGIAENIIGTSNGSAVAGWRVDIPTNNNLRLIQVSGSANTTTVLHASCPVGYHIHALSYNAATGAYKSALDSRSFTVSNTSLAPASIAGVGRFTFGAANRSTAKMGNGSKLVGVMAFNEILSDAQLSAAITHFNTKSGRTFVA